MNITPSSLLPSSPPLFPSPEFLPLHLLFIHHFHYFLLLMSSAATEKTAHSSVVTFLAKPHTSYCLRPLPHCEPDFCRAFHPTVTRCGAGGSFLKAGHSPHHRFQRKLRHHRWDWQHGVAWTLPHPCHPNSKGGGIVSGCSLRVLVNVLNCI